MDNEKARILIVDDDHDRRRHLEWAVKQIGHDFVPATSLPEALQLVEQQELDLAVVDLKLSAQQDEGGFKVLKAIKKKDPSIPVIIVTAYGTVARGAKAVKEGAFDCIDRNIPGVDHLELLQHKMTVALSVRQQVLQEYAHQK